MPADPPAAPPPALSPLGPLPPVRRNAPTRRRARLWGWAVFALLLAGAASWLILGRPTPVQASSVQTAYPSAQYAQLAASGYVVAQRRAAVASKGTGRLVELRVREGSVVKAGDLLARIDASDVQAGVQAATAGVQQAEAGLRQAEAGLRQTEAALQQTLVEQGNAAAELQRARELLAQGFFSTQAADSARRRHDAAGAAVAAARASTGVAQAAIAGARAQQAQAAAQLQAQRVNRDNTEIRAPFDGVVLVKNANVGDMITPFSNAAGSQGAVVTMADMSTLEVEADVAESNVGQLKAGQPVEITLDALPGTRLRGSVARIVPTVDRAKATVMTKIRFEVIDARVLPEMSAKVIFLSQAPVPGDERPVTAVSPKVLAERDGRKLVFRIDGERVRALPVSIGRTLGDVVEITGDALKPGERLVLSPSADLADGARITVSGK